jgi:bacterioferritin
MKRERSIQLLNEAVADELMAVHQYMYFHFHLDDQGLTPLAAMFKRTAIEEMMHIERLAERILFLKGDVLLAPAGPVKTVTDPQAMLEMAKALEEASVVDYNKAAIECAGLADSMSKQLFESLVADEERHYDGWDRQLDNISRFGANYLALQSFSPTAADAPPPAG